MSAANLPDDIWHLILEKVSPRSAELAPPEARSSLSLISFASGLPAEPTENPPGLVDLYSIRYTCSRLSKLSRKYVFTRIVTRFKSPESFQRLKNIADAPSMAPFVKQFSYMIPRFFAYPEGLDSFDFRVVRETAQGETAIIQNQIDRLRGIGQPASTSDTADRQRSPLPQLQKKLHASKTKEHHIDQVMQKAVDQRQILRERLDEACLLYVFERFKGLRMIRLMPLNDKADFGFQRYLDTHLDLAEGLRPSLTDAFVHGARTLTTAVIRSKSSVSRFSSRSLDLGTPMLLTDQTRDTMCHIAKRLTALDLHFVYQDNNIDDQLRKLSDVLLLVFEAAVKLQTIHVGFGRRVSIPLEDVFHGIYFKNLQHLGLHEWRLNTGELIALLDRHKYSLQSLRLRHISLKEEPLREDGLWRTVLEFIRLNLKLEWISLRGVLYNDNALPHGGMQFGNLIYGPPPAANSDSDGSGDIDADDLGDNLSESNTSDAPESGAETEEVVQSVAQADVAGSNQETQSQSDPMGDQDDNHSDTNDSETTAVGQQLHDDPGDSTDESNDDHDDSMSDLDDIHNLSITENPPVESTPRPALNAELPCYCDRGYAFHQLRDNGLYVTKVQWKRWEKWVLKRCERGHDPIPT